MAAAYLAQNIILPLHVDPAGGSVQNPVFAFSAGIFPGGEIPTTWAGTFDFVAQANLSGVHSVAAYGTIKRASNGTISVEYDFGADSASFSIGSMTGGTDQLTIGLTTSSGFSTADVVGSMRLRFIYAAET